MEFFKVLSLEEMKKLFLSLSFQSRIEEVELSQSCFRVLAEDVVATHNWPLAHRSSMDGYALRAQDTFGASENNPVYLKLKGELKIDERPNIELQRGECIGVVTGGLIPKGADSVLMVEYTERLGNTLEVKKSVYPQENIILAGEDFGQGEKVLSQGKRIGFKEIGAMASLGLAKIKVYAKPRVGIISTGDELIEVNKMPSLGQVRDVNSYTLRALLAREHIEGKIYPLVKDDKNQLTDRINLALQENDVVLLSGGSSVGTRDLTLEVLQEMKDAQVLLHGLGLSPGKPTLLVKIGEKFVFGLPGQVTSAQIVFMIVVAPFLRIWEREENVFQNLWPCKVKAVLSRNIASVSGRFHLVRVKLEQKEDQYVATPILGKSGLLKPLFLADGLLPIAENLEGISAGALVEVWKF